MKEKFFKAMQELITDSIKLSQKGRVAMTEEAHTEARHYFIMADATWRAYEIMLEAYDRLQDDILPFRSEEKAALRLNGNLY